MASSKVRFFFGCFLGKDSLEQREVAFCHLEDAFRTPKELQFRVVLPEFRRNLLLQAVKSIIKAFQRPGKRKILILRTGFELLHERFQTVRYRHTALRLTTVQGFVQRFLGILRTTEHDG